jgi:hypothetical protein
MFPQQLWTRLRKYPLKKSHQKKTHLQIRKVEAKQPRKDQRQHLYMSPREPQSTGPHWRARASFSKRLARE